MPIDNYFVERRNQFHKSTLQKLSRGNPFRSLVPMSAFDLTEGRTPTVRTLTHELPTSYPSALTAVGVSDGTGNVQCAPSATTIKRGETTRTFSLFQTSFKTDILCLSDLKRAEQAAESVSGFERALNEYINVWWSDWYRLQNISQVDNKVSTLTSDGLEAVVSTAVDHTGLTTLPTDHINWNHLKQIYWDLVRNGLADELAVGRDSKGRPILPLHAGAGIINNLWNVDAGVKEQVKFFDSAQNLKQLGYDGAVNGFIPVLDLFPIRYGDADGIASTAELTLAKTVYPTVNANATVGRKNGPNSLYKTVARGGRAEFEVVTILGRDVYEAKFETIDPTQFGGASFKPQNYVGEFQWINNKTFGGENDRGNQGYYLADIRCGAKPKFPELGYSIVTKAREV
jgi:hypothetical protein